MSWQATEWAVHQKVVPPARKLLLLVLATYADKRGICWPSQETLAEKAGMSLDSIQRHTRKLKELDLLSSIRPPKRRGQWQTLVYQLSMFSCVLASQTSPRSQGPQSPLTSKTRPTNRHVMQSRLAKDDCERRPSTGSVIEASDRLIEIISSFDSEVRSSSADCRAAPEAARLSGPSSSCGLATPHSDRQPDRTASRLKPSIEPTKEPSASIGSAEAVDRLRAFQAKQESPEVTQNRIARRLGTNGWLVLGELSDRERERLTVLERRHQLDDDTLNQAVLGVRYR